MPARSQAEMEQQFKQRLALVQNGQMDADEAFGKAEEWIIQLGKRKALLHPGMAAWLWYDRLHEYWVEVNCGIEEGILLIIGTAAGMKKLPQPGPVAEWCIYQHDSALQGPIPFDLLQHKLKNGQMPMAVQVWTPRATDWLSAEQFLALNATWGLVIPGEAEPFPVAETITIGRSESCDLTLNDGKVSRQHARIERRQENLWIVDLNSSNGVFVNDEQITTVQLNSGDHLRIGDCVITIIGPTSSQVEAATIIDLEPISIQAPAQPAAPPPMADAAPVCQQCQQPLNPDAKFCRACGTPVSQTPPAQIPVANICPQCGNHLSATARFCAKCGTSVTG